MSDWLLRKSFAIFAMHSGEPSDWKIECDALTDEEIETFAMLIAKKVEFSAVVGVENGGIRIADALEKYCEKGNRWHALRRHPCLIVDDVLTTGASMEECRGSSSDIGVVLFARGPCPDWVYSVFQFWGDTREPLQGQLAKTPPKIDG